MTHYYYPRRRSIFGGLLLILLGIIFLLDEFHPEIPIGRLFYHYWPLLLILWGLARLWDHFAATRSGEAKPPAITGGEVALLLILLFVVGGIAGMDWAKRQNPDFDFGMGNIFSHPYDWTNEIPPLPAKPNQAVSISTLRGNITVHPSDDAQLHVTVHKTASASSRQEAQNLADQVRVNITPRDNGYLIAPEVTSGEGSAVKVNLEVRLPAEASITAQSGRGDITIAQINGPLHVISKNGDLNFHDIQGDVNADMSHGDARFNHIQGNLHLDGHGGELDLAGITGDATIEGDFYGPIRARNIGKTTRYTSSRSNLTLANLTGQMEMDSGNMTVTDLPGSLLLATTNKDITLDNVRGRIDITDKRGDIEARFPQPPKNEIRISDESGNITLTLPANANFDITAVSRSGEIQSDFQGSGLRTMNSENSSTLTGSYGSRGPRITLSTTYGTITIRKAR